MNPDESVIALSGWGRANHRQAVVRRPASHDDLVRAVTASSRLTIRGAGRSYGDAALPDQGTVLDMTAHDRLISFDQRTGILVVEAGALLSDVIAQTLPLGWMLPVVPGTELITFGGAIASDVHGKNHPGAGSFGHHVLWLSLLRSDGRIDRLSAGQDSDAFWATIGGMGLTGVILEVAIQLQRVETGWVRRRRRRTHSLKETLELMRSLADDQELDPDLHVVAWLDTNRQLGRAVVDECRPARTADLPLAVPPYPELRGGKARKPVRSLPGRGVMLRPAIAAASSARWLMSPTRENQLLPLTRALFPLDRAESWPAAFGRAGLVQYQFAVPASAVDVLADVLGLLVERRLLPALTTAKNLGFGTAGPLSFPIPGLTLALDLPARELGDGSVLRTVGEIVATSGGRVYLAKDAVTDSALIPTMYPRLETWQRTQRRLDPAGRLASALAVRLGLLS